MVLSILRSAVNFRRCTFLFKIEQLFKLLIQRNAQNQCQLCSRIKLARFNRTDRIP